MARNPNMVPLGATYHPRELMDAMTAARKPDETQTDFLRAAIALLVKKRGGKLTMPEVTQGRPIGSRKMSEEELAEWQAAGVVTRERIYELNRIGVTPKQMADEYPDRHRVGGKKTWGQCYESGLVSDLEIDDFFTPDK